MWGQLVNFARNYTRLMISNCPQGEDGAKLTKAACRWAAASLHVLRGYIQQKGKDSHLEASHLLDQEELSYLSHWSNPPSGCSRMLSLIVNQAVDSKWLHPIQRSQIEAEVSLYVNMAGACERIYKTAIPAAYTRHTSRFLMIFLFFSPILLWGSTGYATLLVMPIVSFLLIGIENIGVQIEEPFHILPLQAICLAMDSNLREMEQLSESVLVDGLKMRLREELAPQAQEQDVQQEQECKSCC